MSSHAPKTMTRYKDAYLVARVTVGIGKTVKALGLLLGGVVFLAGLGFAMTSGSRTEAALIMSLGVFVSAFVLSAFIATVFYILGVLIAMQGEVLKATLDSAVNSSPFLTDEQRAVVQSV